MVNIYIDFHLIMFMQLTPDDMTRFHFVSWSLFHGSQKVAEPECFFFLERGKKKKPELVLLVFWGLAKNGRTFNLKLVQEVVNFLYHPGQWREGRSRRR